jgi:hypothetical protein
MSPPPADDALSAIRNFVTRIDALDPAAPAVGELLVALDGDEARFTLRAPVARALIEALGAYHDLRDNGHCDHCGSPGVDENFRCRQCGQLNGVFGQLVAERAAQHTEPAAIQATDRGRHATDDG